MLLSADSEHTYQANQPWNNFGSIPTYVTTIPHRHRWLTVAILCIASHITQL